VVDQIFFFFGPLGNPGEQSGPHDVDIVILVSCMDPQVLVASRRHCGGQHVPDLRRNSHVGFRASPLVTSKLY
jgi:hypothetical protein